MKCNDNSAELSCTGKLRKFSLCEVICDDSAEQLDAPLGASVRFCTEEAVQQVVLRDTVDHRTKPFQVCRRHLPEALKLQGKQGLSKTEINIESMKRASEGGNQMAEEEWEETKRGTFWNLKVAKPGDEISGTLVNVRDGTYGKVYDIEQKDKTVITAPSSKVLENRISDKDIGKEIRIVYDSEIPPKLRGHNPTRLFKVFFRK